MVGNDQCATHVRDVFHTAGLDPEVLLVQRPHRGEQHMLGEVGVEAEVIDGVFAGHAPTHEGKRAGDLALPVRHLCVGVGLLQLGQMLVAEALSDD